MRPLPEPSRHGFRPSAAPRWDGEAVQPVKLLPGEGRGSQGGLEGLARRARGAEGVAARGEGRRGRTTLSSRTPLPQSRVIHLLRHSHASEIRTRVTGCLFAGWRGVLPPQRSTHLRSRDRPERQQQTAILGPHARVIMIASPFPPSRMPASIELSIKLVV